MKNLFKVLLGLILCILFLNTSFAAERVVVCEMIGDEQ